MRAAPSPGRGLLIGGGAPPEKSPFGLDFTAEEGPDVARVLWISPQHVGDAAAVARELPEAASLPRGTQVIVLSEARRGTGILARLLPPRRAPLEVLCAALLSRGYAEIGAGACPSGSGELAWGEA